MSYEWTDSTGTRVVLADGHLSLYGNPSMTRGDGTIAIGIDLPDWLVPVSAAERQMWDMHQRALHAEEDLKRLRERRDREDAEQGRSIVENDAIQAEWRE